MHLWQILKMATEGELLDGDCFKCVDTPIDLVLEYVKDEKTFVYHTIMGDSHSREVVSLCDGELLAVYEKVASSERVQKHSFIIALAGVPAPFMGGYAYMVSASPTHSGLYQVDLGAGECTIDLSDCNFMFFLNVTKDVVEALQGKYNFSFTSLFSFY